MSLAKFMAKHAGELGELAKAHKGKLAAAAAIPAAAAGVHELQPAYDDFMQDRAIGSIKRNAKRGALDAMDFAEKHPLIVSGALTGATALGAARGQAGGVDLKDLFNNAIENQAMNQRKRK